MNEEIEVIRVRCKEELSQILAKRQAELSPINDKRKSKQSAPIEPNGPRSCSLN
jgi:hypothetical protein